MGYPIDDGIRQAMGGPPAEWTEAEQSLWFEGWMALDSEYDRNDPCVRRVLNTAAGLAGWCARAGVHARAVPGR